MVRLLILADIHASLPALMAVLDELRVQDVAATVLRGDFLTGGHEPRQVREQMAGLQRIMEQLNNT